MQGNDSFILIDSVKLKLVKCLTNSNSFFKTHCTEKSLSSEISIKNGQLMLKDRLIKVAINSLCNVFFSEFSI